jgi:hypothetical protein
MTRYKAFATHLGISLAIFAVLTYLVLAIWYPDLFFTTDGGWQGMRIIIAVDLVLGPLLTLIVYKHGKPGLKFDLTCIATFQAICLIAGTWLVYSERPLAIIYVDGQFASVNSETYLDAKIPIPDFDVYPGDYPKWLMVEIPEDINEHADFRMDMMQRGQLMLLAVDRYTTFDPTSSSFLSDSENPGELLEKDSDTQRLPLWLAKHGGSLDDYKFYPYGTRFGYQYLGYRQDSSKPIGILDVQPI